MTDNGEQNCNERLKLIFETNSKEKVYRCSNSIVVKLPSHRNSLTISSLNGGYREDLEAVYNHQPKPCQNLKGCCDLEGKSLHEYLSVTAERLGLNPKKTSGMMTAANMKNAAVSNKSFRDIDVTAVVTAGIEVNATRAGDPASFYEEDGLFEQVCGTIITILIINANLSESTLAQAVMTATEAKTVAVQQLMAPSRYSDGIATGSGTDQISVISNMESRSRVTNAGKHSKLGELIGKCVIEATTQALEKQTGLCPESQRDMLLRLERFKLDEKDFWSTASAMPGENKKALFIKNLREFSKNPVIVALTASILHILDEINWGLIPELSGKYAAISVMETFPKIAALKDNKTPEGILDERYSITENLMRITSWCLKSGQRTTGEQ
ncbi:adenosylcobinamide hydrolase [Methanomicrobium sp. W14]|uniref:adenosylcobinamide amidohydrolase n=1 Tax=Methanomicrobium sp. W14 TaxID=2817839 RepID=UPI001AE1B9A8|nr:adenosylcobinamide amidohydrolase [Methanomicrobium sp. W14]MBP2133178.1 adenosylcobinamide hydrolase [Methanomicrobium sp. W14]